LRHNEIEAPLKYQYLTRQLERLGITFFAFAAWFIRQSYKCFTLQITQLK